MKYIYCKTNVFLLEIFILKEKKKHVNIYWTQI